MGVIGDAAHSPSPQLGQGANMALLDAAALNCALIGTDRVDIALEATSGRGGGVSGCFGRCR